GKWLVFRQKGKPLDDMWELVKKALDAGHLGRRAKVSSMIPNPHARNPSEGVICVYTYSLGDIEDVRRIRESLRLHCGVTWNISYKLDSDTGQKYSVQGDRGISKLYE
ncbi:MAG TPA: putative phosphothreonine lyase domain-containing protein, partial [Ktedonobacteraceae bacterium]|nr:putative phosphothreonine lyase domain-containing protein [Ktedonobacteraceae bacterium]